MKARELASASNPGVKAARRLHDRREREETGLFLVEGPHVLDVALSSGAPLSEAFCTAEFLESHAELAVRLETGDWPVWQVSEEVLHKVAGTEQPQGVVAVVSMRSLTASACPMPDAKCQIETKTGEVEGHGPMLVLALEGVSDRGTLGTRFERRMQRGRRWSSWGRGAAIGSTRRRSGRRRAAFSRCRRSRTEDLVGLLERLGPAAARGGNGARRRKGPGAGVLGGGFERPTAVVVGSEASGLSEAVLAMATDRATIPMPGGAESLNAAAAAAVLLYEAVRQRNPSAARRTGNSNCQIPTAK